MAIVLIHLRRIILMCCILYLACDLIAEVAEGVRSQSYQVLGRRKNFKLQFWTHIYVIYSYVLIMTNGFRWEQLNVFELLIATS
jgi:hypothetical protein